MGLSKNYASTLYEWLNSIAPTFRSPLVFDKDHPAPDEYIEYSVSVGNFNTEFIQPITIYSQSTGFNNLMEIVDNIESQVTEKGLKLQDDWGYIVIHKGTPFAQDKPDEDESVRASYVNLLVKIYQYEV